MVMRHIATALLATTALFVGLAQSASAADRAVPYRAPPPPPAPVFSWTGFYIGGHGGCAHDRKSYLQGPFTDADPGPGAVFVLPDANGGGCYGGVQVGYNYQVASWVWGIEADASFGRIRSSTTLQE